MMSKEESAESNGGGSIIVVDNDIVQSVDKKKIPEVIKTAVKVKSRGKKDESKKTFPSVKLSRTFVLRSILFTSLVAAALICAFVSYTQIDHLEVATGKHTYNSVAVLALEGAQANFLRRLQGANVMAQIMSFGFPSAETWPFVNLDGYTEINRDLGEMSASTEHALIVMVTPEEREAFEEFALQMYEGKNFPNYTGTSDFGFGIWKPDPDSPYDDGRVWDTTAETSWDSQYEILTPIVHVAHKQSTFLLYNPHAAQFFGSALESIMTCAYENVDSEDPVSMPPCAVVTDMLEMVHREGPAGLVYTPVYPKGDPNELVGMIATTIFWEDVLRRTVPDYVDGLIAVISTSTQTYTFEIKNGEPVLIGLGDLHDTSFDDYGHNALLEGNLETGATASATYTLTVYPTEAVFEAFTTQNPWWVALGFVGVIAICTALFLLYDFLMRNEVNQRQQILDVKRRFVRFISHEIRTPLNTVCMGLELLLSELAEGARTGTTATTTSKDNNSSAGPGANKITDDDEEDEYSPINVSRDIQENAHLAVEILNDLLNYDKIESGTLKLEIDTVPIWTLLSKSVNQFQIQAANRKVELELSIESQHQERGDPLIDLEGQGSIRKRDAHVIGDDIRLGQVIRNVLSNALKFTPPDGKIDVTATYIFNGLEDAQPIAMDGGSNVPHKLTETHTRAGSICIVVKDSGVGMTKEQLKTVFGEGVQFNVNKLQHGGGSGLGLAITKGIVEQHRGTITVDSDGPGHGTSFIIELPLYLIDFHDHREGSRTSRTGSEEATYTECSSKREEPAPPTKRHILVVEDVHSSCKMLVRLLQRSGHTCVTAANGEIAVRAVADDMAVSKADDNHVSIDCILMDYEMPVLNGPDATEQIRQMGFKAAIFGCTGNMLQEDIDHFQSKGADEVVGKPINMKTLERTWEKYPVVVPMSF